MSEESPIHILWINCGLSCDGDSVSLTAATQPSIEEIALGALPGLPKIAVHWPLIDFECGPTGGATSRPSDPRLGDVDGHRERLAGVLPTHPSPPGGQAQPRRSRPDGQEPERAPAPGAQRQGRELLVGPAPATAASTPCRATRPVPWVCRTTWAGTGSPRPGFRSSAYLAARFIRTTCPRRSFTCCTRPQASRR